MFLLYIYYIQVTRGLNFYYEKGGWWNNKRKNDIMV